MFWCHIGERSLPLLRSRCPLTQYAGPWSLKGDNHLRAYRYGAYALPPMIVRCWGQQLGDLQVRFVWQLVSPIWFEVSSQPCWRGAMWESRNSPHHPLNTLGHLISPIHLTLTPSPFAIHCNMLLVSATTWPEAVLPHFRRWYLSWWTLKAGEHWCFYSYIVSIPPSHW